jgi:DNA-binding LytR/AlgR family response regulator
MDAVCFSAEFSAGDMPMFTSKTHPLAMQMASSAARITLDQTGTANSKDARALPNPTNGSSKPWPAVSVVRRDGSDGPARPQLRVVSRGRVISVPMSDIECFTAAANYVEIHAAGTVYTMRSTMNQLLDKLNARTFARIHRSTIVNLTQIKNCRPLRRGDSLITLMSGKELIVTRKHKDFHQALRDVC